MLSNDWIVMITFGLERWDTKPPRPAAWEIERELARERHEAQQRAAAAPPPPQQPLAAWLFSALRRAWRPALPPHRPALPRKPASRA